MKNIEQLHDLHCEMIHLLVDYAQTYRYFPSEWFENIRIMEEYSRDLISYETVDRFIETTMHKYKK